MKNKMPLDGLGLGHDSGSVHCDMLKMLCFRTAWGGNTLIIKRIARQCINCAMIIQFLHHVFLSYFSIISLAKVQIILLFCK